MKSGFIVVLTYLLFFYLLPLIVNYVDPTQSLLYIETEVGIPAIVYLLSLMILFLIQLKMTNRRKGGNRIFTSLRMLSYQLVEGYKKYSIISGLILCLVGVWFYSGSLNDYRYASTTVIAVSYTHLTLPTILLV